MKTDNAILPRNPLALLKPANLFKATVGLLAMQTAGARDLSAIAPAPAFKGAMAPAPTAGALQCPTLSYCSTVAPNLTRCQSTDPRLARYCQSDLDDAAAGSWANLCDNPPSDNTFGLSKQCVVGGYALGETPSTEPEALKTVCDALRKNKATGCQTTVKPCSILGIDP